MHCRKRWPLALLLMIGITACSSLPTRPAPAIEIDLPRFMGTWYVIAHVPYWLEEGKLTARDVYRLREDGRIDNDYVFKRRWDGPEHRWQGVSTVQPGSGGAHWQVQFVWPFKSDLHVLEVSADYQWALLSNPRRDLAWVFHRQAEVDEAELQDWLTRLSAYGVDPTELRRVEQVPSS
ncbi:lipocalin family protein [Pseudomarimonas arenosa]|uniref:Outer membrane lipoprotein Blc n=1 Tax=Pseudomarimonas arenosa TaxID=2774145 RepID=A0AAW3ZK61_9GAMM|nr:lipocalin family protein [Pseudomarimonas arenosa]MBD8525089.1 lipocalin family protein [Pseudomarimonas arenosa]